MDTDAFTALAKSYKDFPGYENIFKIYVSWQIRRLMKKYTVDRDALNYVFTLHQNFDFPKMGNLKVKIYSGEKTATLIGIMGLATTEKCLFMTARWFIHTCHRAGNMLFTVYGIHDWSSDSYSKAVATVALNLPRQSNWKVTLCLLCPRKRFLHFRESLNCFRKYGFIRRKSYIQYTRKYTVCGRYDGELWWWTRVWWGAFLQSLTRNMLGGGLCRGGHPLICS